MKRETKKQQQRRIEEILQDIFRNGEKDLDIMVTMLEMYKKNKVAVVEQVGGDLKVFEIRDYVDDLMAGI